MTMSHVITCTKSNCKHLQEKMHAMEAKVRWDVRDQVRRHPPERPPAPGEPARVPHGAGRRRRGRRGRR